MTAPAKYLSLQHNYAEPVIDQLTGFPAGFHQGLVIPVYQEGIEVLTRFAEFAGQHSGTLIILIINRPDTDNPDNDTEWAKPFLAANSLAALNWQSADQLLSLHPLANNSGLLLVDRCLYGAPLPIDQGVGLARKIGADILCALIHQQKVSSPWISNSDADATLPSDYFASIERAGNSSKAIAAIIHPYKHIFHDQTPVLPTLLYEFSLHYYVAGLHWAGSPYAYQTLGSTITVNYQHYAMVRGFPKRAGAEDFYLLNKLAKTGAIHSLQQPLIRLQARESTRVPFGTGPAVINLGAQQQPLSMPLYHPECFRYLQFFLHLLTAIANQPDELAAIAKREATANIDLTIILALADSLKLQSAINHCAKQGKNATTRLQHLQHWFDGFKTLKSIHWLREHHFASISFQQWRLQQPDSYQFSNNEAMTQLIQRIDSLDQRDTQ